MGSITTSRSLELDLDLDLYLDLDSRIVFILGGPETLMLELKKAM